MSTLASLPAAVRDLKIKPRDLRQQRKIPAEYYGAKETNQHLMLDYQTFKKIYQKAGRSTLINLQVEGEDKPREILIHNVDYDPLTDEFQHIELLQIQKGKKITTRVPIHTIGESPAVKNDGGILTHARAEIEIRALPQDLISEIVIDISKLDKIGSSIRVADLALDKSKIEIVEQDDTQLVAIAAPKSTEELEAELTEKVETVSEEIKAEGEAEKAAAQARKESDTEKKGHKE